MACKTYIRSIISLISCYILVLVSKNLLYKCYLWPFLLDVSSSEARFLHLGTQSAIKKKRTNAFYNNYYFETNTNQGSNTENLTRPKYPRTLPEVDILKVSAKLQLLKPKDFDVAVCTLRIFNTE